MTITKKELLEDIKQYPDDSIIRIDSSPFDHLEVLSVYKDHDFEENKTIWIDVEPEDEDKENIDLWNSFYTEDKPEKESKMYQIQIVVSRKPAKATQKFLEKFLLGVLNMLKAFKYDAEGIVFEMTNKEEK